MRRPIALAALPLLLPVLLGACAAKTETVYPDADRDRTYRYGSLTGGEGGFSLLGDKKKNDAAESGIGVNSFLWRATLDTVAFMPLVSADPFGGVIISDWYVSPQNANERTKVQVYVLSRELRADALKVTTFRQTNSKGGWKDATVAADTNRQLEDAVLARARELRQRNGG